MIADLLNTWVAPNCRKCGTPLPSIHYDLAMIAASPWYEMNGIHFPWKTGYLCIPCYKFFVEPKRKYIKSQ